jgi:hypothetical protein
MKHLLIALFLILSIQVSFPQTEPVLKIGLVADPQYADKPLAGKRYYRESSDCRVIVFSHSPLRLPFEANLHLSGDPLH